MDNTEEQVAEIIFEHVRNDCWAGIAFADLPEHEKPSYFVAAQKILELLKSASATT